MSLAQVIPLSRGLRGWPEEARRRARHLLTLWATARAHSARRRTEATTRLALRVLDDRGLHDLGLDRSQIPSVAAAVARRSRAQRAGPSPRAPELES